MSYFHYSLCFRLINSQHSKKMKNSCKVFTHKVFTHKLHEIMHLCLFNILASVVHRTIKIMILGQDCAEWVLI